MNLYVDVLWIFTIRLQMLPNLVAHVGAVFALGKVGGQKQ